ncbi:selenoprotein O [Thecamonas trahens ATCC 50062]|uniref:Selenoprotein O n=1 Tax=Thecamonas trahens ATCC 50062 TaxID=461836 RepID=A0A0L0DJ66_THETB|nr:selenoprotein O [Thecamonas trahens ATCC 50062]KNC52106.1 selenoprotein O [Thecamonas trahens ATCC 50062]|eukprot:XP_013762110.1 selenoprotein O [Thecamonas trahens ATCC 50062]
MRSPTPWLRLGPSAAAALRTAPQAAPAPHADAHFVVTAPTPVEAPRLAALSLPAWRAAGVELPDDPASSPDVVDVLAGNSLPPGASPVAHVYAGHQFGSFSGQLGDGAAMLLGTIAGDERPPMELQLKGAGLTPCSRSGDGRKVLRSSLREMVASEAMAALCVPTTRSGSLVISDTTVVRDINYDGRPAAEPAAVITRLAPSFFRFGSFELCLPPDPRTLRSGPSHRSPHILTELFDYVVETHFAELAVHETSRAARVAAWLDHVAASTGALVAHWQALGFCHGVLNTDNMSIHGITLDYGPFAFMGAYDPEYACNASDPTGRYSYAAQPEVCAWNCIRLANALDPLLPADNGEDIVSNAFESAYSETLASLARRKLGLAPTAPQQVALDAFESLRATMAATAADYTATFRALGATYRAPNELAAHLAETTCASREFLLDRDAPTVPSHQLDALLALPNVQLPPGLLNAELRKRERRKLYAEAYATDDDKAKNDERVWYDFLTNTLAPLVAEHGLGDPAARMLAMNAANPWIVPHNWMLEAAIRALEDNSDTAPLEALLGLDYFVESDEHRQACVASLGLADSGRLRHLDTVPPRLS